MKEPQYLCVLFSVAIFYELPSDTHHICRPRKHIEDVRNHQTDHDQAV